MFFFNEDDLGIAGLWAVQATVTIGLRLDAAGVDLRFLRCPNNSKLFVASSVAE